MKKPLLASATFLLIWSSSHAQGEDMPLKPNDVHPMYYVGQNQRPANNGGLRNAFWTEDFANGLNSTNGIWTQSGADQIWKHSFYTTSGQWSTGTPAFASSSAANGFMLFDADSVNTIVAPNYVDRQGALISPSIDCSAEPNVYLKFESNTRWCCSVGATNYTISVSNDGGSTWTDYQVHTTLPQNTGSANPELISLDISAVAGGQSNVNIRFNWGTTGIIWYYWAIDDISLSTVAAGDLAITSTNYFESIIDPGIVYYSWPIDQVTAFDFEAHYENLGTTQQTGVSLNVTIDNGGVVYNEDTQGLDIAPGANDSITSTPPFTATSVGTHMVDYTISQQETDLSPGDNTVTTSLVISDSVFSRENGTQLGSITNGNVAFLTGSSFEIQADDMASSISAYIDGSSQAGNVIYMAIYEWDQVFFDFILYDQTYDYVLTSNDIGSWVTMHFPAHVPLNTGGIYIAVAGYYGGGTVAIGTSGNAPPVTSFFLDGNDNTWYYMLNTPMVRLNLGTGVFDNIDEITLADQFLVAPNPVSEQFFVQDNRPVPEQVNYSLLDVTGRLLETGQFTGRVEIDMAERSPGQYFIEIATGDTQFTKKLIRR